MYIVKFIDVKTRQPLWRKYKWKQPNEIEAIAKKSGWIVASMMKEIL